MAGEAGLGVLVGAALVGKLVATASGVVVAPVGTGDEVAIGVAVWLTVAVTVAMGLLVGVTVAAAVSVTVAQTVAMGEGVVVMETACKTII